MTVSFLWSVFERSGCGSPIGVTEISRCKSVAVDVSIWICEALQSSALRTFHSEPCLYLVYRRTVKLLKIGVKPVFVLEGENRTTHQARGNSSNPPSSTSSATTKTVRRRTGNAFWRACQSCEALLTMMGVPVVRAQAEGEALCALLNSKGLVDGVITNDGDCFLYGAKLIYTNFSVENLERRQVLSYDVSNLRAIIEPENAHSDDDTAMNDDEDDIGAEYVSDPKLFYRPNSFCDPTHSTTTIHLNQEDLISFAFLTGSDLTGGGLPHVGSKKAVRFIHGCHQRAASSNGDSSLAVLQSWRNSGPEAATESNANGLRLSTSNQRCCSICLHPGDRRTHRNHGCKTCGTSPHQECIQAPRDERFRRSLKAKAHAMMPGFASEDVISCYLRPNNGVLCDEGRLAISRPLALALLKSSTIVYGRTLESSRQFLCTSLPPLLARLDLMHQTAKTNDAVADLCPKPTRIVKQLVYRNHPCFEVVWSCTGSGGSSGETFPNGISMFSTIEWQILIKSDFPNLVRAFKETQRRADQGRVENHRQVMFRGSSRESIPTHASKKRDRLGSSNNSRTLTRAGHQKRSGVSNKRTRVFSGNSGGHKSHPYGTTAGCKGDDVVALMRFANVQPLDSENVEPPSSKSVDEEGTFFDNDQNECHPPSSSYSTPCRSLSKISDDCRARKSTPPNLGGRGRGSANQSDCRFSPLCESVTNHGNVALYLQHGQDDFSLPPKNVITCDMGIQIVISPIVPRRCRPGESTNRCFSYNGR